MIRIASIMATAVTLAMGQDKPVGFASIEGEGAKRLAGGTTGGAAGQTVTVTEQAEFEKYVTASQPYVILVKGAITVEPKGKEFRVASDKTILGLGTDAAIDKGGFFLATGVHNVIFRNLNIGNTFVEGDYDGKTQDFDGVQMDGAHHVWIDHCHFDRIGDGMIDSRFDTDYLTVSWNIFSNHNKVFGIGWTENMVSKLTIHHNWFRKVNQRNPSCDNAYCHLFNNYLEDVGSYGNYARGKASMVIENSIFKNAKNPWYNDPDAKLTATGNVAEGATSGKKMSTGNAFDPKQYYSYTVDPVDQVKALLLAGAGPQADIGNPATRAKSARASRPETARLTRVGRERVELALSEAQPYSVAISALDGGVIERFQEHGPARIQWQAPVPGIYLIDVRVPGYAGATYRIPLIGR